MLEQLLRAIAGGHAFRPEDLAHQLDAPLALVEAMLENLEQMGYLLTLDAGCKRACADCSSGATCAIIGGGKIWSLSEKGALAAARLPAAWAPRGGSVP